MERRYLEGISHVTGEAPYSVHESRFCEGAEEALYLHWHPEVELFYLESGMLEFVIEDACCVLRAGEAMLIPPKLLHHARGVRPEGKAARDRGRNPEADMPGSEEMGVYRALVFSSDLIAPPMEPVLYQRCVLPVLQNPAGFSLHLAGEIRWHREVLADLERIFEEERRSLEAELLVRGLLQVIWQKVYENHIRPISDRQTDGRDKLRLQGTLDFIHGHYQEEISLAMLARTAHLSEGQFCRSFRQVTGYTPFTYLKRYRLLQSCVYLAETDKKISEICLLCGFNNISYFNREFLKMMQMKPSAYRARRRGEKSPAS